ncbi:MAG: hypothetical protein COW63_12670 [Bacteroidetes bacterium CG18_big_fil_WC_8_21_14_2_50_41_14]|nr:MAG: hypothetical protein COW63_12670 [Bacteroidetes bacterium CG18_big_fil_WC_8_21_14_2_50_41_14]
MSKHSLKWYHPKIIITIIGGIALIWLFLFGILNKESKQELLEKYGRYEIATIQKKIRMNRGKEKVLYLFYVDGKEYKGSRLYYKSYGSVEPGYQFQIIYFPKDPTINQLLYDKRVKD